MEFRQRFRCYFYKIRIDKDKNEYDIKVDSKKELY